MNLLRTSSAWLDGLRGAPSDARPGGAQPPRPRTAERGRRRSFFSLSDRRHAGAPPIRLPASLARSSGGKPAAEGAKDAAAAPPRAMRRQSVLGFTQLLGRRHSSMQLADRRASADAPASAAAVRRGTGLRRAISIRWGRLKKEAADESASGSSDEGASGRDSDDTLTARDKANPPDAFAGTAPASASTSASDRGSPLASDQGSQATSTAAPTVRSSTSVVPVTDQHPADVPEVPEVPEAPLPATAQRIQFAEAEAAEGLLPTPGAESTAGVAPEAASSHNEAQLLRAGPAETVHTAPQQQPRQQRTTLRRRWSDAGRHIGRHGTALSAARSTLCDLAGDADRSRSPRRASGVARSQSAAGAAGRPRALRVRHSVIGTERVQRLLAGFGDDHGGSARKSSIDGSGRAKRPATHSEHVGWTHSRLSLIPQPTAAERARMDAWAADGDEFLPDEYDLSGVHFELVCTPARFQVARGVSDTAYGGIPTPRSQASPAASRRADGSGSKCTTPGSRVSSTPTSASTVVDDDALSAEQYRRVFVSSAHKLRWPCQGRDMSSIVHVRRIMAKANERYAAAAGRQLLDAGLEPYQLAAADMCGYGDVELMLIGQLRGGIMLPAEAPCRATPQHSDEAPHNAPVRVAAAPGPENGDLEAAQYPARVRSIGCIQRLRHVTQTQTQDSQGQEQDAADAGEPVYGPGALWTGPGDLVSLDPAAQGSAPQGPVRSGGILEGGGRVVAAYQPYRRQRWRRSARRSAFVAVAQL